MVLAIKTRISAIPVFVLHKENVRQSSGTINHKNIHSQVENQTLNDLCKSHSLMTTE